MKAKANEPTGNGHKQAEPAMQTSLQLLSLIMNNIPQAVFWKDRDLVYLGCNRAFAEDAGFSSPQEIVGKTDFDLPWKDEAELYRADDRLVMEKGEPKLNYEEPQTTPDGSTIWLRTSKIPVQENGQIVAVLGMYEDITEYKKADEAIRDERRNFQTILESTRVPTIISRLSDRIVIYANQAIAEVSKVSLDKLIGFKTSNFYVNSDDQNKVIEALRQQGHIDDYEVQFRRTDGSTYWALLSSHVVRYQNEPCILSSYINITERKQTEEVLRANQQVLQTVMDNIPQSIFWKDSNLTYLGCNRAFAKDAGLSSADEVVGKTDWDMPWKEQAELYRADDSLVMKSGAPKLNYEEPQTTPDGSTIWLRTSKVPLLDTDGQVTAVLGMYEDITGRKRSEQVLRDSQQLLQTVMDNIPQSIFWKDSNLTYLGCNRAFARDAGLSSPDEVVGKTDWDMPWKEQAELYRVDDSLVMKGGNPKLNYEEPQTTPDGSTIWLRTSKVPMRDPEENIYAVLGMYEDITEKKNLELQVQTALERRGQQVQLSTQISQSIATATNLEDLYQRVVTQVKEKLGYYYAQILRYEPAQDAVVLVTGYGEVGAKMLSAGHRMPMGTGLIGTAAETGETVMRPILEDDPDWHSNPLLPETKGEIAVPIKMGDRVLGVLDVQSSTANALGADDELLLEGLCGQIATAIESTRLRQEMAEQLEEINRLYRTMSHEGWTSYRENADLPSGFMFDKAGVKPVEEVVLSDEQFTTEIPVRVPSGELVATLSVAGDPQHPMSYEDQNFLQQVSDQIALALESARLAAQTQFALAQTEKLFDISQSLTRAADLEQLISTTVSTLKVQEINRAILVTFNYDKSDNVESLDVIANWWSGTGQSATPVGTHYPLEVVRVMPMFISPTPVFFDDAFTDERVDATTMQLVKRLNLRAVAVLPLHVASGQIGALILEAEEPHTFTSEETRLFTTIAPQIATITDNRRQFERAQKQAEREATLNVINQKIQSATSVEAVLQIAARELGHALGAPMTIAQLSMKDKSS